MQVFEGEVKTYATITQLTGTIYHKEVDNMQWYGKLGTTGCDMDQWRRQYGYVETWYGGTPLWSAGVSSYSYNCTAWLVKQSNVHENSTSDLKIYYRFWHVDSSNSSFNFLSCATHKLTSGGLTLTSVLEC